jgi:hypothetical protein
VAPDFWHAALGETAEVPPDEQYSMRKKPWQRSDKKKARSRMSVGAHAKAGGRVNFAVHMFVFLFPSSRCHSLQSSELSALAHWSQLAESALHLSTGVQVLAG